MQSEYSAFETLHETSGVIATCKELGVAYVAYSPLGHGWLVDDFDYKTPDDFAPGDFRRTCELFPCFPSGLKPPSSSRKANSSLQLPNSKARTSIII